MRLAVLLMAATLLILSDQGHQAAAIPAPSSPSSDCRLETCPTTVFGRGAIDVAQMTLTSPDRWVASTTAPAEPTHTWKLTDVCTMAPTTTAGCASGPTACTAEPGRLVTAFIIQRMPLEPATPGTPGDPPSSALSGFWETVDIACVDVTELNPPPMPAEVFSYFQQLPLPLLSTQHQPPGDGLAGLPVIFYTDSPTTQTFTVDIRGFTVAIAAQAERFIWHTGDQATPTVASSDPGRPYPDQTIKHDYRSGTYTAWLTVTWGATFSVDGGASAAVPGTTTTDGPPVTFGVRQARTVLTNPYD